MTKFDYIRGCEKEDLVKFLCGMYDGVIDFHCGLCVANKYCNLEDNGFEKWLEEDIDE